MKKYILIETEYDVICRTEPYDTLEEAQLHLKLWAKDVDEAMPNTEMWYNEEMTYAHAKTLPYSAGPWAQIVQVELNC